MDLNLNAKLEDSDKLAKIREFKQRGNEAYKAKDYKKAAGSYHRAILYIKGLSSNSPSMNDLLGMQSGSDGASQGPARQTMPPAMLEESQQLTCDCYNNLAACMLKDSEPKFDRIIEHCDKALEVSPSNDKALFRKGFSLYSQGLYSEALEVLQEAASGPEVKKYIELCKAGVKKQDRELADLYKGMFRS